MSYRTGIGYDIHRLVEHRALFLGGFEIPYVKGLLGHSDGDVVLHAICDALLGACGQADIGELFPDSDPQYLDISSAKLLGIVVGIVKQKGFLIENVDTVIVAQEPVLSPFKKQIKRNIAYLLGLEEEAVGVKAKTNEGLGEVGRKEAIAVYSTVLLRRG